MLAYERSGLLVAALNGAASFSQLGVVSEDTRENIARRESFDTVSGLLLIRLGIVHKGRTHGLDDNACRRRIEETKSCRCASGREQCCQGQTDQQ